MILPHLTIPLITVLASQIIKLSIDGIKGNLTLRHIWNDYSGMPSTHSALVASIVTVVGLESGIESPEFGIATVFAIVVIRDALGFRRYLGTFANRLNTLTPNQEHINDRIGHKPREVVVGVLLGILVSALLSLI